MPASPRRRSAAEHVQRRLAVVIPLRRSHSWQLAASLMSRAGQAACSRASRPAASTSPPAAWSSARKSRAAAHLWSIATLWLQPACSVKDKRQSRPSEFDVVSEAPRAAGDRRAVRTSRRQLHELCSVDGCLGTGHVSFSCIVTSRCVSLSHATTTEPIFPALRPQV